MSTSPKYSKSTLVTVKSSRGAEYSVPTELKDLNISQIIRALAAAGWSRAMISKTTNIRYQHVRNVLIDPPRSKK